MDREHRALNDAAEIRRHRGRHDGGALILRNDGHMIAGAVKIVCHRVGARDVRGVVSVVSGVDRLVVVVAVVAEGSIGAGNQRDAFAILKSLSGELEVEAVVHAAVDKGATAGARGLRMFNGVGRAEPCATAQGIEGLSVADREKLLVSRFSIVVYVEVAGIDDVRSGGQGIGIVADGGRTTEPGVGVGRGI